jgi:hypothetical protein
MDPQTSRDRELGGSGRRRWRDGPAIGLRLRLPALVFVLCLAGFFALTYFFGVGVDYRGDLVGSLVGAAGYAALVAVLNVLGSPLLWRLRRWVQGNERQRR